MNYYNNNQYNQQQALPRKPPISHNQQPQTENKSNNGAS